MNEKRVARHGHRGHRMGGGIMEHNGVGAIVAWSGLAALDIFVRFTD